MIDANGTVQIQIHDIPLGACTTAYNKGFECGRIRELAELYPDLRDHLLDIREHIVDFLDPFRHGQGLGEIGGSQQINLH